MTTTTPQKSYIRSIPLAVLAARWDKRPWEDPLTRTRWPEQVMDFCDFAPRVSEIPAPDPLPWDEPHWAHGQDAHSHRRKWHTHGSHYKPRPHGEFTPDPQYVRDEANPILAAFRDFNHGVSADRLAASAREYAGELTPEFAKDWRATPEQVESARKVLTKLRDVMEASK